MNKIFQTNYLTILKDGENILQLNYIYEGLIFISKEEMFTRLLMLNK